VKSSFRIGRIYGIDLKIHSTFFIFPAFFAFLYGKDYGPSVGLRAFVLVLLVFTCVLAHELTHSLAAKAFHIDTPEITLYPIGGIASLQRIPKKPKQEFLIAIAGPLFNFILTIVLFLPLYFALGEKNLFSPSLDSWPRMIANLFWINPVLGLFNLIPAFPMDGGRILRAFLASRVGYFKATRISVFLGSLFAIMFIIFGIWKRHWMLTLIGVFIHVAASNEKERLFYEESTH